MIILDTCIIRHHSTLLTDSFSAKNAIILNPIDIPINIPMHFHMPRVKPLINIIKKIKI